ncbi:uncharacterized protein LOC120008852 [Tripterygium wilfordii]|uniref:uncharacterized protein LOC120008852 n=1 Tax=Tripterygium wilfordii TaxID=458696 RepID=UPI0018F7F374|nr:uncharacterized protein LOC120008852 [Tripterygium wilfordii]
MSPASSVHSDSVVKFERTIPDQASLFCWDSRRHCASSAELRKEIAALEVEILDLESYLLSLYRTRGVYEGKNNLVRAQVCILIHTIGEEPRHSFFTGDATKLQCIYCNLYSPDRLSEEIVRCISSIYCKLANPLQSHADMLASPTFSLSSSIEGLKSGPYGAMIEILKIYSDEDSFNFAATMLQNFRSLVHRLEKVDPRKMKQEEKLAFWINIHNALEYLVYGTRSRVKSGSVLKAAYNVGGHCINAYLIQSSILGIKFEIIKEWQPARRIEKHSVKSFFNRGQKYQVRVYRAKNIFQDLKLAKEEYIEANMYVHKEKKILLPRILYYFALERPWTCLDRPIR